MVRVNSKFLRDALKLYFIFGSNNCLLDPIKVLEEAISGGITIFQFREKGSNAFKGEEKIEFAKSLQKICKEHGIPFIVNDDVDLAIQMEADGVHIGQEDESVELVRRRIGDKILGVSAHTMEEARKAIREGADYLGIGPIFPTTTKRDAKPVQGTAFLQSLRKNGIEIPLVGIGGINAQNARTVIQAGADGVAVITAISQAEQVMEATIQLKKEVI